MAHHTSQAPLPAHHSVETPVMHDAPDAWHDHTRDERPQPAHGEVGNANAIMGIGIALFLVIVLASVAVYAYYTWFLAARLAQQEVASGRDSPAIQARQYQQESRIRLEQGGLVNVPAAGAVPAASITVTKIGDAKGAVARRYSAPPTPRAAAPTSTSPAAPSAPVVPAPTTP